MKLKSLYKALIVTFVVLLTLSCNDTLDEVGFTIQPDKDRLEVSVGTLLLQASTVQVDSIYAQTKYPVLGEYIDPVFGSIKSEYIGEFYFPEGAGFKAGAAIDSVRVVVSYSTIMGDSLAPMELSVYEVNKTLEGASRYTHTDPEEYADMSAPLGKQLFTGKNNNYRTESYTDEDYSTVEYTVYDISVILPDQLGEKFLSEYNKAGHGQMVNAESFRKFFPGLYFTTTFGNSTMLYVNYTSLYVHYHYLDELGSSLGQDTIRTDSMRLHISPEVTQINHIKNNNDQLLGDDATYTYVKSPAGVNTEIKLPLSQINDKLKSQALNMAKLTLYAMPEAIENPLVKLSPPTYLLLVNKDSLAGFFEGKKLNDGVTSFLSAEFDTSTYSYVFSNISTMINHYNEEEEGEPFDLDYYLIPVEVTFVTDDYGNVSVSKIYNQMWPTAAMLDNREGNLKLELIFSNF